MRSRHHLLLAPCIVAGACLPQAKADVVAEFYRGRTVTLVVSSNAAGGYDTFARAVARYIGKHIPGNPTVIVRNMPGAGGMTATNFLYNNADKDGSVIGLVQNNTPFEPLFATKEARYDPVRFNWLGSPSAETAMVLLWHAVPVNSVAELKAREVAVGVSGANSTPAFFTRLLNATLGTKMKPINGYPGQNDVLLAMERREIDGHPSAFFSSVRSTRPNWLRDRIAKAIVQYGAQKLAELPDVPFAPDIVANDEDRHGDAGGVRAAGTGPPVPDATRRRGRARGRVARRVRRDHGGSGFSGRRRKSRTGVECAAERRTDPGGGGARLPKSATRH